jgi:hypothetical protein
MPDAIGPTDDPSASRRCLGLSAGSTNLTWSPFLTYDILYDKNRLFWSHRHRRLIFTADGSMDDYVDILIANLKVLASVQ